MDALVFVAGDVDFKDMLDFVSNTLKKKVIIFGWDSCTSQQLKVRASEGCFFPLDEIWEHISEPLTVESSTVLKDTNTADVCRYYLKGACMFKDKCRNLHPKENDKKQCALCHEGKCNKGDECELAQKKPAGE
jgi:hypothetical protein